MPLTESRDHRDRLQSTLPKDQIASQGRTLPVDPCKVTKWYRERLSAAICDLTIQREGSFRSRELWSGIAACGADLFLELHGHILMVKSCFRVLYGSDSALR